MPLRYWVLGRVPHTALGAGTGAPTVLVRRGGRPYSTERMDECPYNTGCRDGCPYSTGCRDGCPYSAGCRGGCPYGCRDGVPTSLRVGTDVPTIMGVWMGVLTAQGVWAVVPTAVCRDMCPYNTARRDGCLYDDVCREGCPDSNGSATARLTVGTGASTAICVGTSVRSLLDVRYYYDQISTCTNTTWSSNSDICLICVRGVDYASWRVTARDNDCDVTTVSAVLSTSYSNVYVQVRSQDVDLWMPGHAVAAPIPRSV
eukprot:4595657-Pyramimonas_sp.AAC.1